MKNSRQTTPTSHATRMAACCLKLAALIAGWGSVAFYFYSRSKYGKNPISFLLFPSLEEMSNNTGLQVSWILLGASFVFAMALIALFLFGRLDRESLMKPYALSVSILLPTGFLFFFVFFFSAVVNLFNAVTDVFFDLFF